MELIELMRMNSIKILCKKTKYIILECLMFTDRQDLSNLRQGMVSIYLAQAIKNKKILVIGGQHENRTRDFIYR